MGTTNILDLNNRVSALEKVVSDGDSAQANKKDIATKFSATTAYTAGCFVYYQGKLYQFNTDHAAGAWDSTDVVEANVTDQIVSNKAAIDELADSYPASKVMMSDGVTSVEDALGEKSTVLFKDINITINNTSQEAILGVNTDVPFNKILSLTLLYNASLYYFIRDDNFDGFKYTIDPVGKIFIIAPYGKNWSNVTAQRTLVFRVAYLG